MIKKIGQLNTLQCLKIITGIYRQQIKMGNH